MDNAVIMQAPYERKASSTVTKQKYKVFDEKLEKYLADKESSNIYNDILELFCDAFNFDPNKSGYDKEKMQKKCLETGKTSYQIYMQKYYEKNKAEVDRKNVERTRRVRAAKKELLKQEHEVAKDIL